MANIHIHSANGKHLLHHRQSKGNIYSCFFHYTKAFDSVDHNKLWNTLKEMGILHWMLQFSALKFDFFFCHFCMFYVSNWHFAHMYTVMITVKVFSADFYIVSLLAQFDWLLHSFISFLPVIFLPLCMTGILWLEPKCGQSSPLGALAILVFLRIFLSFMGGTFEWFINGLIPLDLPFMIF